MKIAISGDSFVVSSPYMSCIGLRRGWTDMAAWRRAIELSLEDADVEQLKSIAQSRTEPASRVERARILLCYREDPSFYAVGQTLGLHHQTIQRCGATMNTSATVRSVQARYQSIHSVVADSRG